MTIASLVEEARDLLPEAVELRRRLHRRPEIGLELKETQAAVLEALDGMGLSIRLGENVSSVVARLAPTGAGTGDEGGGPAILLRADMDALPMPEDTGLPYASEVPGAMHACGHDAHVAMLVGAARLLDARRTSLPGQVVLMFQPGEEGHHGARYMIEEGLLDGPAAPEAAFAIHITPTWPTGTMSTRPGALMASADVFRVDVRGRGGHASMPHLARDPVPVACEIVSAIQTMVTRRLDAFDPAVVTVGKIEAGTTNNVIPESAAMVGTIRAVSEATRRRVHELLSQVAEGIAAAHGAAAEVTITPGYPVTVNDESFAGFAADVAADLIGPDRSLAMDHPVMGAEDFSYVLQRVPGAMAFLGARPAGDGPVAHNHSNRMVLDEEAMVVGMAMYAAVALRWFERRSKTAA